MKYIKENEIILEENDEIIISMMRGNKIKIKIQCLNGALFVDDVSLEKIQILKEDEKAIKAMQEYMKKE